MSLVSAGYLTLTNVAGIFSFLRQHVGTHILWRWTTCSYVSGGSAASNKQMTEETAATKFGRRTVQHTIKIWRDLQNNNKKKELMACLQIKVKTFSS